MLSFKQFLAEDDEVSGFLKNARTMLEKGIFLYRGTNSDTQTLQFGNPDDNDNYFTGYIGRQRSVERRAKGSKVAARLSKGWDIPDRSMSVFVTRDASHAIDFGNLLLVIPADNVDKYGYSATDFNLGSSKLFKVQLHNIEEAMNRFIRGMEEMDHDQDTDKISLRLQKIMGKTGVSRIELNALRAKVESKEAINFVEEFLPHVSELQAIDGPLWAQRIVDQLEIINKSLESLSIDNIADVFAEASMESFKLKTFSNLGDIPKKPATADELWFSGKFLAINLLSAHTAETESKNALRLILGEAA